MSTTGFSYAQAARGQAAPKATIAPDAHSSSAIEENSALGSTAIPAPESSAVPNTTKHTSTEANHITRKIESDADSATDSATLIDTLNESASNLSFDGSAFQATLTDKTNDISPLTTRPLPSHDNNQRENDDKAPKIPGRDSDTSPVTEIAENGKCAAIVTLSPAPVPVKNIWEERRRELAAKSKQITATVAKQTAPAATGDTGIPEGAAKSRDMKKASGSLMDQETKLESSPLSSVAAKSQPRRSSEVSRAEQSRRSGPRGTRAADKETNDTAARNKLPPVQDATLWPTPNVAAVAEDAKVRVTTDKTDKDNGPAEGSEEGAMSKSRKKGAWVTLDFVPTVNFQTPIPNVRGSKPKTGGRGGRDASRGSYMGVSNDGASSDKMTLITNLQVERSNARDGPKESANGVGGSVRAQPQSSNTTKRHLADSAHNRESRKALASSDPGHSREDYPTALGKAGVMSRGSLNSAVNRESGSQSNDFVPNPSALDRRYGPAHNNDHHLSFHKDNDQHAKEHKGRVERFNRGGFRGGRGGHINSSTQSHHFSRPPAYQVNGPRMPSSNAFHNGSISTLPPSAAPFTPSPQQSLGNGSNGLRGRVPGRTQATPQVQPSFTSRMHNGIASSGRVLPHAVHLAGISSDFHLQQQSFPLPSYTENEQYYSLLARQLEYYFSLENLCKDMFLRKKMDGQGFVPLSVVASFRRMTDLAPSIDFIRAACEQSEKLDYIVDKDQNELIRSRHEWRKFVLPNGQRAEEARVSGPDMRTVQFRSLHSRPQQAYFHPAFVAGYQGAVQGMLQTPVFQASGSEVVYPTYDSGVPDSYMHGTNGQVNGRSHASESQLSAAVPDFSPASPSGAPMTLEDYQNCPDEQVEKLVVVVASDPDSPEPPEKNIAANHSPRCQEKLTSPNRSGGLNLQKESQSEKESKTSLRFPAVDKVGEEPYAELRARAFEQRRLAKDSESPVGMRNLYRFWCHCLMDKFNVRMYEDFRSSALDDARGDSSNEFGLRYLLQYYNRVLTDPCGSKPYPSVFVPHYTEAKELYESRDRSQARHISSPH